MDKPSIDKALQEAFLQKLKEQNYERFSEETVQIFKEVFAAIETLKARGELKNNEIITRVETRIEEFARGFKERLGATNADVGNKASKQELASLSKSLGDFREELLELIQETKDQIPESLTGEEIIERVSLIDRQWLPVEVIKGAEDFVSKGQLETAIVEIGGKLTVLEKRSAKGYGALGGGSEGTGSLFLSRLRDVNTSGLSKDADGKFLLGRGGGSGGAVDSVNGQTGVVVLTAADVGALDGVGVSGQLPYWFDSNTLGSLSTATYPDMTELSYVKGLTSGAQTQLDSKFTLPSLTAGSVLFSNGSTIAQDNANFFWDDSNNRLGIGTASPNTPFDVNGSATLRGTTGNFLWQSSNDLLILDSTGTGGTNGLRINNPTPTSYASIGFNMNNSQIAELGSSFASGALIGPAFGHFTNAANGFVFAAYNPTGVIDFITGGLTTAERRMHIAADGKVGIGTASPSYLLDVNGTTRIGTLNGLIKGTSGVLSVATAGTDYQAPITLTTTGSSGAATLIGNTLNIPQYSGGGGGGDVVGPASATDNAIARFDTTTGKLIQNSAVTIADTTGVIAGSQGLMLTGVSSPSYVQGGLVYDTDNESLTFFNNDSSVALQVGQEEWIRVINNTGSTIANGVPVYLSGASGGIPTIALARANAAATTIGAGLTTESIANGATGYVTWGGLVRGINTSAFAAGATVYIDATTPGALTSTAPLAPNYRYRVGIVGTSNASTGTIHVTPSTAALGNGIANQVFGMNSTGTAQEVKTLGNSTTITAVNAANSINFTRAALTGVVTAASNSNTTAFGTFASSALATALTDETGTGSVVFSNSPTLVTPILGTPTSGTLTNTTGFPVANLAGAGTGVLAFLATPSSANLATAVTDETGSGALVFATSPTLVTPALGTPSALVLTNATGLPVAGGGTGVASLTAYAPIFGGTTSTGPVQSGTVGTAGQVLTSNGAGALPTFQSAGGTGALTQVPPPVAPLELGNTGTTATVTLSTTSMYVGQIVLPRPMVVNSVSLGNATNNSAVSADVTLFSEDGQTMLFSVTATLGVLNSITSIAVSSVSVPAGIYYIAINAQTGTPQVFVYGTENATINQNLMTVAGKGVVEGSVGIAAGTPAAFTPSSVSWAINRTLFVRFDN